jgi:hypothetical protein
MLLPHNACIVSEAVWYFGSFAFGTQHGDALLEQQGTNLYFCALSFAMEHQANSENQLFHCQGANVMCGGVC